MWYQEQQRVQCNESLHSYYGNFFIGKFLSMSMTMLGFSTVLQGRWDGHPEPRTERASSTFLVTYWQFCKSIREASTLAFLWWQGFEGMFPILSTPCSLGKSAPSFLHWALHLEGSSSPWVVVSPLVHGRSITSLSTFMPLSDLTMPNIEFIS